jgi:predicted lipoprotein with Yx(FWY)xxD motif
MKSSTIAVVVALLVVLGGGYWYWSSNQMPAASEPADMNSQGDNGLGDASTPTGSTGTTASPTQDNGTTAGQTVALSINADATLGQFLVAANGKTVYTYDGDQAGVSNCNSSCADTWPPYTVSSAASIKGASNLTGTVGTITRDNGSIQVTYNGKPLYFYSKDTAAGKAAGQGSGGVWFIVKP